ncbi:MAG: DUF4910 domain-containing protein [Candidatus Hydrogenedentes bacterium]|nr:DUF4910 domain-containing protein [Candidatus Hydrogenedentota bacterium]
MHEFARSLFPICRSITGPGFRETMARVEERIPVEVHEVPSGTAAFDWVVPREWRIRDAYVKDAGGCRVIDFQECNLHVVGYSVPVQARMTLDELRPHLHTLPDKPDWIPYRTSYYTDAWGFCLTQRALDALIESTAEGAEFEVCVDSTLEDGALTYAECLLPGSSTEEVLISCHACHPSLANDNLSGMAVAVALAQLLGGVARRYSYRFVFIPGTIGSIVWLSRNEEAAARIRHGLVIANVGDPGDLHYKKSRRGDAEIDRAVGYVLGLHARRHVIEEFSPYGYDERQYCSPGFDLPVGSLTRTPFGRYPEYHTSADNLDFIEPAALEDSLAAYLRVFEVLEGNGRYVNRLPKCEPQLGKRGLYRAIGTTPGDRTPEMALLWVLNQSDGEHTLLDIAVRSGLPFAAIRTAADALLEHGLLGESDPQG